MILSDFLSRQKHDNSNPHEIIPISFNNNNINNIYLIKPQPNNAGFSGAVHHHDGLKTG